MEVIEISNTNTKIEYIYHIADIHIPNKRDRIVEYEEVFSNLYEYLLHQPKGIIVIAGDVYNEKTIISSEALSLFNKFMRISNIMPTFVIRGNHDMALTGSQVKDCIESSVEMYDPLKVIYLNATALYKYENILFGVKHFNDKTEIIRASSIDPKYKDLHHIAVYHGSLYESVTDCGMKLNFEENIKVSTFDGYDLTLLGDVHLFQTFANRRMAYSSSLIQQNHGENINMHGLIKWTLSEKGKYDLEFVRIMNSYGFMTINIENNKIVSCLDYMPQNIKLRVFYKNTSLSDVDKIISSVTKGKNIISQVKVSTMDYVIDNNIYDSIKDKKELFDVLIEKYISANSIDNDIMDEIKNSLYSSIQNVYNNEQYVYDIKKLTISNMFCYGLNNVIDFKSKKTICGLLSENMTGKTSIIDCILLALYDKTSKDLNKKQYIRYGETTGSVELEISLNNVNYRIVKTFHNSKPNTTQLINLDINEDVSADNNILTSKKISSMFPNESDFNNIHCILQNDNNHLLSISKKERLTYVFKALGLNDNEILKEQHHIHSREVNVLLNEHKERLLKLNKQFLDLQNVEYEHTMIKDKILEFDKEISIFENEKHNLMINKLQFPKYKENDYINNITNLEKSISTSRIELGKLEKELETNTLKIEEKNKLLNSDSVRESINISKKLIREKNMELQELYSKRHSIETTEYDTTENIEDKIITCEKEINSIGVLSDEDYSINKLKIEEFTESIKDNDDLHKKEMEINNSKLNKLYSSQHKCDSKKSIEELNKMNLKLNDLEQKIIELQSNLIVIENDIDEKDVMYYLEQISLIKEYNLLSSILYNEKCDVCVSNNYNQIKEKERVRQLINPTYTFNKNQIDVLQSYIDNNNTNRDKKEKNKKLEKSIEELMKEKHSLETRIDILTNEIEKVKVIEKENVLIRSEIDSLLFQMKESETKYNEKRKIINTELVIIRKQLEEDDKNRKLLQKKEKELNKYNLIVKNLVFIEFNRIIDKDINICKEVLSREQETLEENEDKLSKMTNEVNLMMKKNYSIIDKINSIKAMNKENDLVTLKHEYNMFLENLQCSKKLTEINNNLNDLNKKIRSDNVLLQDKLNMINLKKNINEEIIELTQKVDSEDKKYRIHSFLDKAFDVNGLCKTILSELIPKMKFLMNRIVFDLCNSYVDINEDFDIFLDDGVNKRHVNNSSGSERLIIGIAFRLMINEYSNSICKSTIMFIDESFVSFDSVRRGMIRHIIMEILKRYKKVLIISHMEELKGIVNDSIEIKKFNNISAVVSSDRNTTNNIPEINNNTTVGNTKFDITTFSNMSVTSLRTLCKSKSINNYSKLKKEELVKLLQSIV